METAEAWTADGSSVTLHAAPADSAARSSTSAVAGAEQILGATLVQFNAAAVPAAAIAAASSSHNCRNL